MSNKPEYSWKVGELCTCTYGNTGHGVIYRVMKVGEGRSYHREYQMLEIAPAFAVVASTEGRGKRKIGAGWCTPLTLVEMATSYARFGTFIADEAKRLGAEDGTA